VDRQPKIYSSYANVEFRYPQFIPDKLLDSMKWQTNNWKYEKLTRATEANIRKTMTVYLDRIRADFENGKLRQGGKSFAEGFISNLMINAFPGIAIKRNVSPMANDEFYIRQKQ